MSVPRGDLFGILFGTVHDDRLCRSFDKVGAHEGRLCEHRTERHRAGCGVDFEFLLHDVTRIGFEGWDEGNNEAVRSHSRDHRRDCPLASRCSRGIVATSRRSRRSSPRWRGGLGRPCRSG